MKSKGPAFLFLHLSLCLVTLANAHIGGALRGTDRFLQQDEEPGETDDFTEAASQGLATIGVIIIIIAAVVVACACACFGWFCCCL